jgi:hypothetical protein
MHYNNSDSRWIQITVLPGHKVVLKQILPSGSMGAGQHCRKLRTSRCVTFRKSRMLTDTLVGVHVSFTASVRTQGQLTVSAEQS